MVQLGKVVSDDGIGIHPGKLSIEHDKDQIISEWFVIEAKFAWQAGNGIDRIIVEAPCTVGKLFVNTRYRIPPNGLFSSCRLHLQFYYGSLALSGEPLKNGRILFIVVRN